MQSAFVGAKPSLRAHGRQMWIQGDADARQRVFRGDFVPVLSSITPTFP